MGYGDDVVYCHEEESALDKGNCRGYVERGEGGRRCVKRSMLASFCGVSV